MKNIKITRALGFLMDYIVWYLLMYLLILFYFFVIEKQVAFSGDLKAYGEIFSNIMHKQSFLGLYILALFVYEILIPLCFGGQSFSKKMLKIKIEPFRVNKVITRGLLKLLIINPCGVISYLFAGWISGSAAMISDGLWIVLAIDCILVYVGKPALHDMINKTTVKYKGEANEI